MRRRGFTLIELMIASAIMAFAITAVTAILISETKLYRSQNARRQSQGSTRQALSFLEKALRDASYGVDPGRAIIAFDSYNAAANAQGVNFPDALAIHQRDPRFSRIIPAGGAAANQLTISPALTEPLRKGQILLALCAGARVYSYAVVGTTAAAGNTTVQLDTGAAPAESPVGAPGSAFRFRGEDPAAAVNITQACFNDGTAVLTKVDRLAFYVAAFDDDNNAGTPPVPYLMLHRGVDTNADGVIDARDATPMAAGVEQLQVAYVLNTIDDTPPPILGVNAGIVPGYGGAWMSSVTPAPTWADPYTAPSRLTQHPANIRQVRVTLVARGLQSQEGATGDDESQLLAGTALSNGTVPWRNLENLGTPGGNPVLDPQGRGFARSVFRIAVVPKNYLMRAQFLPTEAAGG